MPKRKTSTVHTPTQNSLSSYLLATKASKRVKREAGPFIEHGTKKGGDITEKADGDEICPSSSCTSGENICVSDSAGVSGPSDETTVKSLVRMVEMIDEVLKFAGKGLLWSRIQEEIYSLHKR
jgi:hypothetical protein